MCPSVSASSPSAGAYTRPLFGSTYALSVGQGVHLGGVSGVFGGCLGGIGGCEGVLRVYCVSETAQIELKSGRG